MIILHCLRKRTWDRVKDNERYGKEYIETEGFIHCSSIEHMWRVAPNFKDIDEPLLLLCIDTDKVIPEIKWEDGDNCGREYPHIYGELNLDAVVDVLPFLKDKEGNFILNPELERYI